MEGIYCELKKSFVTFISKKLFASFVSSVWSQSGSGLALQTGPLCGGGGGLQESSGEAVHRCGC